MMDSAFRQTLFSCLREEMQRPGLTEEDAVKFLFQGLLGVGHLLPSEAEAEARLAREMASLTPSPGEPLTQQLSPDWVRLNLRPALAAGLTPKLIARLMRLSPPARFSRGDVLEACAAWAAETGANITQAAARLSEADWLPSHSASCRALYQPAYRVIGAGFLPLLPALALLPASPEGGRRLWTLDGPCASGKTTLAALFAAITGAFVLHTDDFVVPHSRKTSERLSQPGGNCDWERLVDETLLPWTRGEPASFRRYDCHADALLPPEPIPDTDLLLLEGSCCNLPAIRALAHQRLFCLADAAVREKRLAARESPASLARFRDLWIPLENAYFAAFSLPDQGMVILRGDQQMMEAVCV